MTPFRVTSFVFDRARETMVAVVALSVASMTVLELEIAIDSGSAWKLRPCAVRLPREVAAALPELQIWGAVSVNIKTIGVFRFGGGSLADSGRIASLTLAPDLAEHLETLFIPHAQASEIVLEELFKRHSNGEDA